MPLYTRPQVSVAVSLFTAALLVVGGLSVMGQGYPLLGVLCILVGVGYLVLGCVIWRGRRSG